MLPILKEAHVRGYLEDWDFVLLLWTVGIIHVILSLALVGLVLVRQGSGGMSDLFGGGIGAGGGGGSTVQERNLDRMTVIFSVFFTITTIVLVRLLG